MKNKECISQRNGECMWLSHEFCMCMCCDRCEFKLCILLRNLLHNHYEKILFQLKIKRERGKKTMRTGFQVSTRNFVIFTSSNMMHWFHSWIGCDAIINTRNLCGNSCKTHDPFAFTSSNPFIVSFIWQMCARLCGCN